MFSAPATRWVHLGGRSVVVGRRSGMVVAALSTDRPGPWVRDWPAHYDHLIEESRQTLEQLDRPPVPLLKKHPVDELQLFPLKPWTAVLEDIHLDADRVNRIIHACSIESACACKNVELRAAVDNSDRPTPGEDETGDAVSDAAATASTIIAPPVTTECKYKLIKRILDRESEYVRRFVAVPNENEIRQQLPAAPADGPAELSAAQKYSLPYSRISYASLPFNVQQMTQSIPSRIGWIDELPHPDPVKDTLKNLSKQAVFLESDDYNFWQVDTLFMSHWAKVLLPFPDESIDPLKRLGPGNSLFVDDDGSMYPVALLSRAFVTTNRRWKREVSHFELALEVGSLHGPVHLKLFERLVEREGKRLFDNPYMMMQMLPLQQHLRFPSISVTDPSTALTMPVFGRLDHLMLISWAIQTCVTHPFMRYLLLKGPWNTFTDNVDPTTESAVRRALSSTRKPRIQLESQSRSAAFLEYDPCRDNTVSRITNDKVDVRGPSTPEERAEWRSERQTICAEDRMHGALTPTDVYPPPPYQPDAFRGDHIYIP